MNNYVSREMIIYLFNVLGLDESTIELCIKLSKKKITLHYQYYYGVMEC